MMTDYRKRRKFSSKYRFTNILCYVPKRYDKLNKWQHTQRTVVENFKNGHYDDALCQHFERIIKEVTTKIKSSWVITFVPPSIGYEVEYDWRYRQLAEYLQDHLSDIPVAYYGVTVKDEWSYQSKNRGGRRTITSDNLIVDTTAFIGKSVILIDDVITTGYSFRVVGDALMAAGAIHVHGVILAMTIHPNLPIAEKKNILQHKKSEAKEKVVKNKPSFTLPFPEVATPEQLSNYQVKIERESNNENSKNKYNPTKLLQIYCK